MYLTMSDGSIMLLHIYSSWFKMLQWFSRKIDWYFGLKINNLVTSIFLSIRVCTKSKYINSLFPIKINTMAQYVCILTDTHSLWHTCKACHIIGFHCLLILMPYIKPCGTDYIILHQARIQKLPKWTSLCNYFPYYSVRQSSPSLPSDKI